MYIYVHNIYIQNMGHSPVSNPHFTVMSDRGTQIQQSTWKPFTQLFTIWKIKCILHILPYSIKFSGKNQPSTNSWVWVFSEARFVFFFIIQVQVAITNKSSDVPASLMPNTDKGCESTTFKNTCYPIVILWTTDAASCSKLTRHLDLLVAILWVVTDRARLRNIFVFDRQRFRRCLNRFHCCRILGQSLFHWAITRKCCQHINTYIQVIINLNLYINENNKAHLCRDEKAQKDDGSLFVEDVFSTLLFATLTFRLTLLCTHAPIYIYIYIHPYIHINIRSWNILQYLQKLQNNVTG